MSDSTIRRSPMLAQTKLASRGGEGSITRRELIVELTLICTTPDGPSAPLSQLNKFVLDRKNGTLTNINDDPVPVPNLFHKISK